jgi:type VI secretion system protein ImpM
MDRYAVPKQGMDVPAWFGKLPGLGDFAQRRMTPGFLEVWDPWLQRGLQQMRAQRDDWLAYYLEAPLWCFALGPGIVGVKPWIGVLMPSVDSVGRCPPWMLTWTPRPLTLLCNVSLVCCLDRQSLFLR